MQNEQMLKPRYAKPKIACQLFGIGLSNLYKIMGENKIESVKIGNARRVDLQSMEDYFESLKESKADMLGRTVI